jgi:protein-glutamine gamma-glutamyltransferase
LRRELHPGSKDKLVRAYAKLCAKLATAGLARLPHEGAEAYAARVAALRPDLAASVTALCRQYSQLRYASNSSRLTLSRFQTAVRTFRVRPLDSPASSRK